MGPVELKRKKGGQGWGQHQQIAKGTCKLLLQPRFNKLPSRPKLLQKNTLQRKCFGAINFVIATKESLYKANPLACFLPKRDTPVPATLQRKSSGGIIFVIITKITVRVKIITGSLVTLENLFPENYRYRYRLEIRMNYHYRYGLGPRSRPFISIDSQLPSRKLFEIISLKLPLPLPSWNVCQLER